MKLSKLMLYQPVIFGVKLLPFTLLMNTLPDGALPAPWVGAGAVASGVFAITPTISPTDLLTNPGFEGTYVAGVAPNWAAAGTPTVAESADAHGGTAAQSITNTNQFANRVDGQGANHVVGTWYKFSVWNKKTAGVGNPRILTPGNGVAFNGAVAATYTQTIRVYRATATTQGLNLYADNIAAVVLWDDASDKALSGLITYRDFGAANVKVGATGTVAAGYHAGVVARVSANGSQYLYAYHDRTTCFLVKVLTAGVTQLIGITTAYVAGILPQIRCNGDTIQLFYNGAQVGTDQTETTLSTNTRHGLFSTDVSNTFNTVTVEAN